MQAEEIFRQFFGGDLGGLGSMFGGDFGTGNQQVSPSTVGVMVSVETCVPIRDVPSFQRVVHVN